MTNKPIEYRILALYRFVPLTTSLESLKEELLTTLRTYDVKGTLLIAPEGINGTVCYPYSPPLTSNEEGESDVENKVSSNVNNNEEMSDDPVAHYLKNHPIFGGSELRTRLSIWKDEEDNNTDNEGNELIAKPQQAFHRLKIKIKEEIVTLGLGRPLVDRKPINNTTDQDDDDRQTYNEKSDPNKTKGQYLNPTQWDEACHNPNILVIDTRNTYEIDIGTFESAINPNTDNFSDFPKYLEKLANEFDWNEEKNGNEKKEQQHDTIESDQTKKKPPPEGIAMFCTGGIRCEKATSYALQTNLFKDVPIYHLEGGILGYLDDVAKRDEGNNGDEKKDGDIVENDESSSKKPKKSASSTFHGECFVFDKRVAVKEGLKPTSNYIQCHGCRGPMNHRLLSEDTTAVDININGDANRKEVERYNQLAQGIPNLPKLQYDDKTRSYYLPGLTCPRCHSSTTRDSLLRFAEREKQVEICKSKGESLFKDNAGM